MIDRQLIGQIDWFLIGILLVNSALGIVFVYSSSHYLPGNYYLKQMLWMAISLVSLFVLLSFDYKILLPYSVYAYGVSMIILLGMLLFNKVIAGTKSWIRLSGFQVQPSELIKIVLILLLSYIFAEYKKGSLTVGMGILSAGLLGLPFLLVAQQPDLGTALSFLPLFFAAAALAGLNKKMLAWMLIFLVLLGAFGWNFYLKDYQKKRLATVVFPGQDPSGSGYHILQSKIAIGSGGFFGKGLKKGTQSQLHFLPARHTDFIFSVIGEELGFAGILAILATYFLFLSRLFRSVSKSRDRTGVYIIFMVAVMFSFQALVNIMMVIGLFPIVGIPLPLLSYGGSSLLTNFLAAGLVINVKMRRFVNI